MRADRPRRGPRDATLSPATATCRHYQDLTEIVSCVTCVECINAEIHIYGCVTPNKSQLPDTVCLTVLLQPVGASRKLNEMVYVKCQTLSPTHSRCTINLHVALRTGVCKPELQVDKITVTLVLFTLMNAEPYSLDKW